jgi:hypothetical protein
MHPHTERFTRSLRQSHTVVCRVDAWSGPTLLARDLPVSDGSVAVSSGTGVHRKLDITIPDKSLWDLLSPVGVELRAYRGIRYPGGDEELIPLGVFSLDQQSIPVLTGDGISISSAPDRYAAVQRARFETPRTSEAGFSNVEQIARLVQEVVPTTPETGGITALNDLADTKVGVLVWDRDRDKAIEDLCVSAGVEAFFGPTGQLVIRDVPVMDAHPVWRVTAGRDGVMLAGTATRDRTRVYNVIVVVSSKTDGSAPFRPVIVEDTDPTSPTNVNGPYGRCPYFLTTATISNTDDARKAGQAMLAKTRGRYVDMNVEAVVNPALTEGDTVAVTTESGQSRLYLLDSFGIPLVDAKQTLTLRSLAAVTSDASS